MNITTGGVEGFATGLKKIIIAAIYAAGVGELNPFNVLPIGAIWFLWALFWALCLLFLLKRFDLRIGFCLSVIIAIVAALSAKICFLPFSIQPGCFALPYLYIGRIVKKQHVLDKYILVRSWKTLLILIVSLTAYLIMVIMYSGVYLVNCNYGHGWLDYIGTFFCSAFVCVVASIINDSFPSKLLHYYGANSLLFLAIHNVELYVFPYYAIITKIVGLLEIEINYNIVVILIFIAKLIIITLSMQLLARIPLTRTIFRVKDVAIIEQKKED